MKVTFLTDTPNVHLHHLTDDDTANIQGYADCEVVCHACGRYIKVLYVLPKMEDIPKDGLTELVKIRDEFERQHKSCVPAIAEPLSEMFGPDNVFASLTGKGNQQFRFLCPDWRKFGWPEKEYDLRK